jgi:hypothetical protein
MALGVIDTISAGFRMVTRRLWLMLIPVLLDIFLWLGPKLSVRPIVEKTLRMLEQWLVTMNQSAGAEAGLDQVEATMTLLQSSVAQVNLFRLLVWGSLGVPSVAGARPIRPGADWVLQVSEYWQVLPLEAALLAAGLLIAATFLSLLGHQVRGEPLPWKRLAGRILTTWLRLVVVLVPIGLILFSTLFVGMLLGPLMILAIVGLLWVLLYIAFFPQAIALAGHKPLNALMSSFQVVRLNLWPTVGLLLLVALLSNGLGYIWQRLAATSEAGTLVAILASAYVGTALTAALFIFYRDRLVMLHNMIRKQRST